MYEVQTYTIADGWVNCWTETDDGGERPIVFPSAEEAWEETMDHFNSMMEARMDFNPLEYRLVKVDNSSPNREN